MKEKRKNKNILKSLAISLLQTYKLTNDGKVAKNFDNVIKELAKSNNSTTSDYLLKNNFLR